MISQDAKVKNDRYLTLNVNFDMSNVNNLLTGNSDPVY